MIRKRNRGSTSEKAPMADYDSSPALKYKFIELTSSLFSPKKLFTGFTSKGFFESDSLLSPTSILDGKPFSCLKNPFWPEPNNPRNNRPAETAHKPISWCKQEQGKVGLGIIDALAEDNSDSSSSKQDNGKILFGSKLKIQFPSLPASVPPKSPADSGIKTSYPVLGSSSSCSSSSSSPSPVKKAAFSASEMELSEDYTCVIEHGSNPKTTHIFDDCIVECTIEFSLSSKENGFLVERTGYSSNDFLSFCYTCKRNLLQGEDIYMYRGEKAFCSCECRYQEMMLEADGGYGSGS